MKRKLHVTASAIIMGLVILLMPCYSAFASSSNATEQKVFDFEDGTNMGFFVDEGGALASTDLTSSNTLEVEGNLNSLKLETSFDGTKEWHELRIAVDLDEIAGTYNHVDYDIFIPMPITSEGGFKAQTIIKDANWAWTEIGELEFFGLDGELVTINDQEYLLIHKNDSIDQGETPNKQLIIRLASYKIDYTGPIYVDNIILSNTTDQSENVDEEDAIVEEEEEVNVDDPVNVTWKTPEEGKQFTYDFSESEMGWHKAWGEAFGENPVGYEEIGDEGLLKVNVAFAGTNWQEANVSTWFKGYENTKFDLTKYERVNYDVLIPATEEWVQGFANGGVFKIATALNDNWAEFATWSDYKESDMSIIDINNQPFYKLHLSNPLGKAINRTNSGQLVIRLSAWNIDYTGPIFIDNVTLAMPENFAVFTETPKKYDIVKGIVDIKVNTLVPENMDVKEVIFIDDNGQTVSLKEEQGLYTGKWDTTLVDEGFSPYMIQGIGIDASGETIKVEQKGEVFVSNSLTKIDILSPDFDSIAKENVILRAKITSDQSDPIEKVVFKLDGKTYEGIKDKDGTYSAELDTTLLEDGVYTLVVIGKTSKYVVNESVDFLVENKDTMNHFVEVAGSEFVVNNKALYFGGWNNYYLPFRLDETVSGNQKVIIYTKEGEKIERLIEDGTVISFEDHVDRMMLEAKRLGLSVVRTWGFNNRSEDETAYYIEDDKGNWVANEAQFERMDYVLDSARRHGVRVIITLEDYWDHYGGIAAAAKHFGLDHTLQWFANDKTQDHYKGHIERFFNRVNTVNGMTYKEDPAIFAWDLMNEPRMDYNHDTSEDKYLYDITGKKLGAWLNEISTYAKDLEPKQLIFVGAEGHGILRRGGLDESGENYWAGTTEGWGKDPIAVMNQPNIDFFSIHPYPTVEWADFTLEEAINMVEDFVAKSLEYGKPIVMSEWGIKKTSPLRDPDKDNQLIYPGEEGYDLVRLKWNRAFLEAFNKAGGNGNNIWMLQTNPQESNYGINVYNPDSLVEADQPFTNVLKEQADFMNNHTGQINRAGFIHMLVSQLELTESKDTSHIFKDVLEDDWYNSSINIAYANGLINGTADSSYNPEEQLSCEQMIVILVRAYEQQKGQIILASANHSEFNVSDWAIESMNKASKIGLLEGWAEFFNGADIMTRMDVSKGIDKLLELMTN